MRTTSIGGAGAHLRAPGAVGTLRAVRALRRAAVSLFVAVVAMAIVRLRGSGGTPPRRGGWRELPVEDLPPAAGR